MTGGGNPDDPGRSEGVDEVTNSLRVRSPGRLVVLGGGGQVRPCLVAALPLEGQQTEPLLVASHFEGVAQLDRELAGAGERLQGLGQVAGAQGRGAQVAPLPRLVAPLRSGPGAAVPR